MPNHAVVEENPDATKYAEERCRRFLDSQTPQEALPHLWHISQLVDKLSDKHVEKVLRRYRKETDDRIHYEQRYLAKRWIGRFMRWFVLISIVLFVFSGLLLLIGLIFSWPIVLTVSCSFILALFGIEGILCILILYLKQRILSKNE